MTDYKRLIFIIAISTLATRVKCHGTHVSVQEQSQPGGEKNCFNSFDNFDECWEKIEEFCLNEATGQFEDCHGAAEDVHDSENHKVPEDDHHTSSSQFQNSRHCYARLSFIT